MKTIMTIDIERKPQDIIKETKEQRAERIKYASATQTKVIPNKKKYNRKKFKKVEY